MIAQPIANLMRELKRLPGIGEKTALRLALHILSSPGDQARGLARALTEAVEKIRPCSVCFQHTETDPCEICRSGRRDHSLVCVVEDQASLMAIENTGNFFGVYHVLGGRLSPINGIGPDDLKIAGLVARASGETVKEVVLATSPNVDGEATALYIKRALEPTGARVTRIARGVPMGGDLEFIDSMTLGRAMEGRSPF